MSKEDSTSAINKPNNILRKLGREVHSMNIVFSILFGVTSPEAQIVHQNAVLQQSPSENEVNRLKRQIEQQYSLKLTNEWTSIQLQMFKTSLELLPEKFVQGHPGRQLHTRVNSSPVINAECSCTTYLENTESNIDKGSLPNLVEINVAFFQDQELLNIITDHELAHALSLIYVVEVKGKERPILWYQDEVEGIIGMPFEDFTTIVNARLQSSYPLLYQEAANIDDIEYESRSKPTRLELLYPPEYDSLAKVLRWMYATGSDTGQASNNKKYPVEFIAVLAEWYIQGEDVFMKKTDGVIPENTAKNLYYYLNTAFFQKQEYDTIGRTTKPPANERVNETGRR